MLGLIPIAGKLTVSLTHQTKYTVYDIHEIHCVYIVVLAYFRGNQSCLVMAPTSAGKTFIAFEIVREVTSRSNDEVVVFVCPNKALVHYCYLEV